MILEFDQIEWSRWIIADVRSESEWISSHIPGAVSIPVLDDASREEVGIVYRNYGREEAVERGLEKTLPQLETILSRFQELLKKGPVLLYCARGGMRSQSLYNLLSLLYPEQLGLIEGGYKAYRQGVLKGFESLCQSKRFYVLQGNTGVGKSRILDALALAGAGTLHLERMAHHAGSVFGNIPFPQEQPTQKQFENDLYHCLLSQEGPFFTEAENQKIGRLSLPEPLYRAILQGEYILVEAPMWLRIRQIREDYVCEETRSSLGEALDQLRKLLGHRKVDLFRQQIDEECYDDVIQELMESYYDPLYARFLKRDQVDYRARVDASRMDETIEQLQKLSSEDTRML